MVDQHDIQEGMIVRSSDGEKLGKVVRVEPAAFVIERGFFFRKDYLVRYDEVGEVRDGEILLKHDRERLFEASGEELSSADASRSSGIERAGDEIRVPLVEEELRVTKRVEEAGEVRVKKEVVTEEKQVTVPVSHEVVRVERVPATAGQAGVAGTMFKEESVAMPLREERIEVETTPVVKEEVRIRKDTVQGQETAAATVRREEAEVSTEGRVITEPVDADDAPVSRIQGTDAELGDTAPERATGTGGVRR